jgi:hypothetical protein
MLHHNLDRWQGIYAIEEFPYGNRKADLIIVGKKNVYEFEIKITISDLKAELKKGRKEWYGEKVYYIVPTEIAKQSLQFLKEYYPECGLYSVDIGHRRLILLKKAKLLPLRIEIDYKIHAMRLYWRFRRELKHNYLIY